CRWTPPATCARGKTGTGRAMTEPSAGANKAPAGRGRRRPDSKKRTRQAPPVPSQPATGLSEERAIELLTCGTLEAEGRLVAASNATVYCRARHDGAEARWVYKPVAGERPLWNFPGGSLAGREVAAYAVSRAAGWDVVPPTVMRDGPFGPGMCQLWI